MKKLFLLLLVVAGFSVTLAAQKKTFLRVYNLSEKKIAKGFFAGTTDNALLLFKDTTVITIPLNQIGIIKTKRTIGHSILLGSVITGIVLAIPFVASSGGDGFVVFTPAEGLAAGLLGGGGAGALIGAAIGASKKRQVFEINGKADNWLKIKPLIDQLPVYKILPGTSTY
jgi:hypothetical protein